MRKNKIIKTSIFSIIVNILLSFSKLIIGLLSNSIAIITDSINNITDALSSIITIIGTSLASKKPDKKHPYGYGRFEYLSALSISVIILYAGLSTSIESIKKILAKYTPNYNDITIIVTIIALITKLVLGIYVKKTGIKYNSESLKNSGQDALLDCGISLSTLISIFIYLKFNLNIEAYVGLIISTIIVISGFKMLKTTTSQILGERIDKNISKKIKNIVKSYKEVNGIYDLILNNYGPDNYIGSFHIEISDNTKASHIDHLTRKITSKIYQETNVIISAIGIYTSSNNENEHIKNIIKKYPSIKEIHGLYINEEKKDINFDIIFDFNEKNKKEIYEKILKEIKEKYINYNIYITIDIDISD